MYSYTIMYKQNDEQMLKHTKVTLGEHDTKLLHLCQITTWHTTQVYISKTYWEQKYSSIVVCFLGATPHLNYFLLCHCQHILQFFNIVCVIAILIFDLLRLSGIERSNYIESNNLGQKSCPVFGIEGIRYSGWFITLKNRREKFGTDEIVRFYGDSGIERIWFRGFLL